MPDRYFDKFPIITYANSQAIDITKRVALLESASKNPYIYYPYEISGEERCEQLSYRYYNDPYKSWMIYLTNKIVDPYYEWYLHNDEFNQFIIDKYGSVELASDKILFYRHYWSDAEPLSISGYNALTARQKSYWEPVYGVGSTITSYSRKPENWTINTNKIVKYTVSNSSFTNNEICNITFNVNYTGQGQILYTTNTSIYVQHTSGTTVSNSTVTITGSSRIYGTESLVNTAFTVSNSMVTNLAPEEEVYWTGVTCFDYETEKNEFNKTVRLIDNRHSSKVVNEFRELMKD